MPGKLGAAVLVILAAGAMVRADTFVDLGQAGWESSDAVAISGSNVVGSYVDSGGNPQSFFYNGSTYTTFNAATNFGSVFGQVTGVSGDNAFGYYLDPGSFSPVGFIFNGATNQYTSFNVGANGTMIEGISGNVVYGTSTDSSFTSHGFSETIGSSAPTTLDDPDAVHGTTITAVDGNEVAGYYENSSFQQIGFVYNGSTFDSTGLAGFPPEVVNSTGDVAGRYEDSGPPFATHAFYYNGTVSTIDPPGSTGSLNVTGIDGNTVVGTFYTGPSFTANGFSYDASTNSFGSISDPFGAQGTTVNGIAGNTVIGFYVNASGAEQAFEGTLSPSAVVPTPQAWASGLGLLGIVGWVYRSRRRRLAAGG